MKLASAFNHVKSKRTYAPSDVWVLPTCHIGLEWEFENGVFLKNHIEALTARGDNAYLACKEDGSLRDVGVEIVTMGDGLFGADLHSSITMLSNLIKELPHGRAPICNYRTAFHVHLDIRDMETEEVHNLLLLYCLLEKPIFNFVGKSRENSNFCVPWFRSDAYFQLLKGLQGGKPPTTSLIKGIANIQRYSALNCQSIQRFGTLEFRHMENCIDEITTKQVSFINLAMSLKVAASSYFAKGLHGESLFKYFKEIRPAELFDDIRFRLPTTDWDYSETLMLATGLVQFQLPRNAYFNDAGFSKYAGHHPNWK